MGHPVHGRSSIPPPTIHQMNDGRSLVLRVVRDNNRDIPQLAEVYSKAYTAIDVGETWSPKDAMWMLLHIHRLDYSQARLAELDGKVVGGIFPKLKPWEGGNVVMHVDEIFVDPEYQGQRIGTLLLEDAVGRAIKRGATSVELETFAGRENPQKWYRSLGFDNPRDPELQILAAPIDRLREGFSAHISKEAF